MDPMQRIALCNAQANRVLSALRESALSQGEFVALVREYILTRLALPPFAAQDGLYELCVLSLKLMAQSLGQNVTEDTLKRMEKYDCHQLDVAVKRKVMLMMHLERELGIPMDNDTVEACETVSAYALALWKKRNEVQGHA